MQIISGTLNFHLDENTVVTVGKFDGIHKGHLELIKGILNIRKQQGLKTAVMTFDTPPSDIIPSIKSGESYRQMVLSTSLEKRKMFQEFNIDYLIEFPFTEETAAISAEQFVKQILMERLHMCAIVTTDDWHFGRFGSGNVEMLKEYGYNFGFDVEIIDKVFIDNQLVSSSDIRKKVEGGRIEEANRLLVRPYMLYGEVVHGNRIGRTMGMPTVNLIPEEKKLLPPCGVYYSRVNHMGQEYRAITNIGYKPTITSDGKNNTQVRGVETYIYNFDEYVYGDYIYVSLYKFVRSEMKFETVEILKEQMQKDIAMGEKWHRDNL